MGRTVIIRNMSRVGNVRDGQWPAVAGAALSVPALAESITRSAIAGSTVPYALLACLVAVGTTLPLALPRPMPSTLVITVASVLSLALLRTLTVAGLCAAPVSFYRFGRNGPRLAAQGMAVPFLVLALVPHPAGSELRVVTILLASLVPAASWAGLALRARSEAQRHTAASQAVARTVLEHATRGERARIARELHDVVAHYISVIAVQAEMTRLATPGLPAVGAERLLAIGDNARVALAEMSRLLGVLRADSRTAPEDLRPQPGLQELNDLLDLVRDTSDAAIRLIVSGIPPTLDPSTELVAYRIVQEALTNARRHAPDAAVDVELRYTDDGLLLRIRDNGPGPPPDMRMRGHGLLGMRERAMAAGGRLRVGSGTTGGFLVEAALPAKPDAPV
jgi:signal transduction histidine kinase